jgi:hypothetical protein
MVEHCPNLFKRTLKQLCTKTGELNPVSSALTKGSEFFLVTDEDYNPGSALDLELSAAAERGVLIS